MKTSILKKVCFAFQNAETLDVAPLRHNKSKSTIKQPIIFKRIKPFVARKPFQTASKLDYRGLLEAGLISSPCRLILCSERRSFLSRSQAYAPIELVSSSRSPARSEAAVLFPCDSWRWLVERLVRSAVFSRGLVLLLKCSSVQLTVSTKNNTQHLQLLQHLQQPWYLLFKNTNMKRLSK